MSNNHQNSFCPFAEQLVSYLYDESSQAENIKFETHLENCPQCADELESFGFVRASVADWRAAEFSTLPTPIFAVTDLQPQKSFATVADSTENQSWLAGWRQLFALNPATAMAAFGVLAVCLGLTWFAFNFKSGTDVAEIVNDKNFAQVAASPIVETNKKPETIIVAGESDKKPSPKTVEVKSRNETAPIKSAIKVSSVAPKSKTENAIRQSENSGGVKKIAPVKKQTIPNLNDVEEDEDETIRLADLFAELDTK